MYTYLVGQSKLFQAALTKLLVGTVFEVAAVTASLLDVPLAAANGSGSMLLVQKPDKIADYFVAIESLKSREGAVRIVLMARTLDASEIASSFACGVDGYLLEEISPAALIESLNLVALGEKVFPSQLVTLLAEADWCNGKPALGAGQFELLSEREFEIVHWLARGAPNKVIAGKMSITEATVKVHIKAILKKVGATNRTQAAIWAIQRGVFAAAGE